MRVGHATLLPALVMVGCSLGQPDIPAVFTAQVASDPITYLGRPIKLEGTVAGTEPGPPPSYQLVDASGGTLTVRTARLPEVGANVRLYGQVAQAPENVLVPVIIEAKRADPGRPSLLSFAILVVVGSFFLMVLAIELIGQVHQMPRSVRPTTPPSEPPLEPEEVEPRDFGEDDQLFFRVLSGIDKGREYTVKRRRAYIGRGSSRRNDVELSDPTVSRRQAVVAWSGKRKEVVLINEADTNPSTLRGRSRSDDTVRHGDVIKMGHVFIQVFFEPPTAEETEEAAIPPVPASNESAGPTLDDGEPGPPPPAPSRDGEDPS